MPPSLQCLFEEEGVMPISSRIGALAAAVAVLGSAGIAGADETFSGPGGPLNDDDGINNGETAFTITVSGFPGVQVASLKSVTFTSLSHTYLGDLGIGLLAPDGLTSITVTSPPALESSNLNGNYTFVVDSVAPFQYQTLDEAASFFGDDGVVPSGTLAASDWGFGGFGPRLDWQEMQGVTLDGDWTVFVVDFFAEDTGALGSWSFTVTIPEPAGLGLLSLAALGLLSRRRFATTCLNLRLPPLPWQSPSPGHRLHPPAT